MGRPRGVVSAADRAMEQGRCPGAFAVYCATVGTLVTCPGCQRTMTVCRGGHLASHKPEARITGRKLGPMRKYRRRGRPT